MRASDPKPAGRILMRQDFKARLFFPALTIGLLTALYMLQPPTLTAQPATKEASATEPHRRAAAVEAILSYAGPNRQEFLEAGARKEGRIVWFATLNPDTRDRIAAA